MKRFVTLAILCIAFLCSYAIKPGFGAGVNTSVSLNRSNLFSNWSIGVQGEKTNYIGKPAYLNSILSADVYNFYIYKFKNASHTAFSLQFTELLGMDFGHGWGLLTGPNIRLLTNYGYSWNFYWCFGVEKLFLSNYLIRITYKQHLKDEGDSSLNYMGYYHSNSWQNSIQFSFIYKF